MGGERRRSRDACVVCPHYDNALSSWGLETWAGEEREMYKGRLRDQRCSQLHTTKQVLIIYQSVFSSIVSLQASKQQTQWA